MIVYAGATQILLGRKPSAARTLPGTPALVAIGLADRRGLRAGVGGRGVHDRAVHAVLRRGDDHGDRHRRRARRAGRGRGHARLRVQRPAGPRSAAAGAGLRHRPALLGIVAGSVLTAPIGARAAHRMPVATLRRIFAGLLYVLATKMLWTYV